MGFRYKWNWGIDLTVGVYCQIDVFYVLSVAPEYHFGLLSLLGLDTNVQKNIRGNLTNRNFAYQRQTAERDLPRPVEVVFEDLVSAPT